ncbi:MAG: 6-phosphogluconolactonase [Nitrospirota bacterium]|nr:6-phosphogluconolactonase [Nitrospirota bacterium]
MASDLKGKYPMQLNYGSREIMIFRDSGRMADHAAVQWEKIAENAVKKRGRFSVALSGGRTPAPLYRNLSKKRSLPWDRTFVFMVDERFVPYESDENNFRMIHRTLLQHVNVPQKNIHPVSTLGPSAADAAAGYGEDVALYFRNNDNGHPRFDLILLGIGEDGHTASLFPGDPSLKETERLCIAVAPGDRAGRERITLTLPVINNAENVIFLAAGEDKAKAIKEIAEEDSLLPAAMVRPRGNMLFLLDPGAASRLSLKPPDR